MKFEFSVNLTESLLQEGLYWQNAYISLGDVRFKEK